MNRITFRLKTFHWERSSTQILCPTHWSDENVRQLLHLCERSTCLKPSLQHTTVEGAMITSPNNNASNGIVHIVDKLLLPPNGTIADMLASRPDLTVLKAAVDAAGLTSALAGELSWLGVCLKCSELVCTTLVDNTKVFVHCCLPHCPYSRVMRVCACIY